MSNNNLYIIFNIRLFKQGKLDLKKCGFKNYSFESKLSTIPIGKS